MRNQFSIFLLTILWISACNYDQEVPENPFDPYRVNTGLEAPEDAHLAEGSFAQLHRDIFKTSCANAGCHDGHFEPDFRSIESSYNTLVFQPVIKNNAAGDFEARVVPFNTASSVLWERLNRDIDGQSGIMPLVYDPDSDWPEKRDTYLSQVKKWIDEGAKDIFGNVAVAAKTKPYIQGLMSMSTSSNNLFPRDGGNGSMLVPQNIAELRIWLSIVNGEGQLSELGGKLYLTPDINDFRDQNGVLLEKAAPLISEDFEGEMVPYSHLAEVRLDSFSVGERIFIHAKLRDPDSGESIWIPSIDSPAYIKELFSIKLY